MENHGLRYSDISDVHLKLNNRDAIPKISSDLPQYPRSQKVQAPLQNIFRIYIDCYLTFITQYAQTSDRGRELTRFVPQIVANMLRCEHQTDPRCHQYSQSQVRGIRG